MAMFIRSRLRLAGVALAAAVVSLVGCGRDGSQPPAANVPGPPAAASRGSSADASVPADVNPAQLLAQMAAAYKQAHGYQDAGELQLAVVHPDGSKEPSPVIPFSVAFERPNKIRIHALEASLVGTGDMLLASIDSLRNQVLQAPAPATLSLDNLEVDDMLAQAMRGQLDIQMPQLQLLLGDDPIGALAGSGTPVLLADEELHGQRCHRVSIDGPDGASVFWIDPAAKVLRKFEFPSKSLAAKFSLSEAAMWAEFKGASLDGTIAAAAFEFAVPAGARRLARFLPPPPEPPSALLGKTPAEFSFVDYRGGEVSQQSLQGKVVVLDMWATWCGWCFEGFPNVQQVYDQFKDNDKVVVLAVNTDEVNITDEQVRESFAKANLSIPIVRDTRQAAANVFEVQGLPTMVVLGTDGKIEDFHVGYDANLATTLPAKIERLLAGESLAADELARYEQALEAHRQEEAAAEITAGDDGGPYSGLRGQ